MSHSVDISWGIRKYQTSFFHFIMNSSLRERERDGELELHNSTKKGWSVEKLGWRQSCTLCPLTKVMSRATGHRYQTRRRRREALKTSANVLKEKTKQNESTGKPFSWLQSSGDTSCLATYFSVCSHLWFWRIGVWGAGVVFCFNCVGRENGNGPDAHKWKAKFFTNTAGVSCPCKVHTY